MATYRRKPTTVEAQQFTDYTRPCNGVRIVYLLGRPSPSAVVTTMQGRDVEVDRGEWIVAEPDGKHF